MSNKNIYNIKNDSRIFIISGPSGSGKSSLSKMIIEYYEHCELSISSTTRDIRHGEINGIDYNFIDKLKFHDMITNNELVEYVSIYDNMYGTSKEQVLSALEQNKSLVFDIDWRGYKSIKNYMPQKTVGIFILPPSISELKNRLLARGRDSIHEIEKRLKEAEDEVIFAKHYDYQFVNYDINNTFSEIKKIIENTSI